METAGATLDIVRRRIDAIDADLLRLVDERAALALEVLAAKRAEARDGEMGFALRPAREAQLLRRLLASDRPHASDVLIVAIWRELISDSIARQGRFSLSIYGGRAPGEVAELARARFGRTPRASFVARAEEALAAARTTGTVAVLQLEPGASWWARLLAQPELSVFAVLPCLATAGPPAALAVAKVDVEPSGADMTLWATDAAGPTAGVEQALVDLGLVGDLLCEAGGMRLFALAGFVQREDERLRKAPGRLQGVIGSAPRPFDL